MSASQGHDASQTRVNPGDERQQRVLSQFRNFPFSSDEAFQQGLSGILAHEPMNQMSDHERSELILKTKVFYFNRLTGHDISLEDVQAGYTADVNHVPVQGGNECNHAIVPEHGEIRVLTFTELKSLIEQGKTDNIPNNEIILDTLNDGVPSESIAPLRRKPWEATSQS